MKLVNPRICSKMVANISSTVILVLIFMLSNHIRCIREITKGVTNQANQGIASSGQPTFAGSSGFTAVMSEVPGRKLEDYYHTQEDLYGVDLTDYCSHSENPGTIQRGQKYCDSAFNKFLRIPREFRGVCAEASRAGCYQWTIAEGRRRMCSFFVRTSPSGARREEGQWKPIKDCADGLEKRPALRSAKQIHGPGRVISDDEKPKTELDEYHQIQEELSYVDRTDYCLKRRTIRGMQTGRENCVNALNEFLRIPQELQGECAGAVRADCYQWTSAEGVLRCCFFVRTSPAGTRPERGQWKPIKVCTDGLKKFLAQLTEQSILGPGSTSSGGGKRKRKGVALW